MDPIVDDREQEDNVKKGKLVRVELSKGRFVKMYEQDAVASGLLPGKLKPAGENKMRAPEANKATKPLPDLQGAEATGPVDDFTVIDGIGPATARLLQANGIRTYAQLIRAERLDFLRESVREAIARWKADNE